MSDVTVQSALAAAQITVTGLEAQLLEVTEKRNTVMAKLAEAHDAKVDGFQVNFYTGELTYSGKDAAIISAFQVLGDLKEEKKV